MPKNKWREDKRLNQIVESLQRIDYELERCEVAIRSYELHDSIYSRRMRGLRNRRAGWLKKFVERYNEIVDPYAATSK